ncbi:basement membrane-specific heparan sulfate proteoglycan core protein-like [Alosa pseudoharengus]|uniref:basement membrane-specific heparan sulfate proteoglycan core protein-like n=1 Tax=Alosa pseudoharengus TaxID=34774 RepID=UPI003F88B1C2
MSGWRFNWHKDYGQVYPRVGWSEKNEYTLKPLHVSHSGDYTCTGLKSDIYSRGNEKVKLQVSALPTPKLTLEPQSPVYVGETVTLKCEVQSDRNWKYVWYEDWSGNVLFESDENTHTITAETHEKYYWCQVKLKDLSSQMSEITYVEVKDPPLATVAVESPQPPFYAGETVTLRCDIAEYTGWNWYTWYKDNQISRQNSKTNTIPLPYYAGQHTCKGWSRGRPRNSQRSTSFSISVTALPTPTLSVQPETPVFTGEEVTLKCEIEPEGVWKYKWYKDGDRDVLSQGDTNTFTIRGAAESHKGQYWCQGERADRPTSSQPSRRITLSVKALPTATVTVESPEGPYYPGDEVTLRCDIAGYTDWNSYNWNITGHAGDPVNHKNNQTITITLPDKINQSLYTCDGFRYSRPHYSQSSDPLSISVRELPLATLNVKPQSPVFTGENVTLKCVIESLSGWTYKWYKESSRTPVSEGNTFTIRGAAESHKGQYWCQGERRDRPTSSQPSRRTTLDVKDSKPKLTLSPDHQPFTGDSVALRCELGVSSGLVFYWYRHTQTFDPVNQTDGNSYSITSVKVSDGGQYWCRAGRGDPVFYTQYSDAAEITVTERPKPIITLKSNRTEFFSVEEVSLRCVIRSGEISDWEYIWFRDGVRVHHYSAYEINPIQSGRYTCKGNRKHDMKPSEESDAVGITIYSEKAQAVLSSLSQPWLTEGDSVTLSCEVRGSTTGWRFHWYNTAPYRPELAQVTHESRAYSVELLSDSIRGAGGSYTLSPAALRHTGVYVCRAERGEPAYHTEFSQPQPLWVTGLSLASVSIHSNWTQIFTSEPLSLSCGVQGNSTGWRLRWFTGRGGESKCPTDWRSETGSSCSISSASPSDSGVYWCQSESGEQSNPVNITVHNGDVILENPAHPVTEGDPLTLHCRYRYQPSNISADFYKDGTLLQTSTTGEMTIPAVSKSHEGLYKCSNPERGESPESWVAVKDAGISMLVVAVGVVIGLLVAFALVILLVLLYRSQKAKGSASVTSNIGPQQSNSHSSTSQKRVLGGAVARTDDAVYAEIELRDTDNNKEEAKRGASMADPLYSLLGPVKSPAKRGASMSDPLYSVLGPVKSPVVSDGGGDGSSDVTYAKVKKFKHRKQDSGGPVDVTYSDVQIKIKPLGSRAKPVYSEEEHVYSAVKPGCSSDVRE